MRNLRKRSIILGVASGLALSLAYSTSTFAAEDFAFSFDTGNVAFAYTDGYWDSNHHWHKWHNSRERVEYKKRFADHYNGWKHDRDADHGLA